MPASRSQWRRSDPKNGWIVDGMALEVWARYYRLDYPTAYATAWLDFTQRYPPRELTDRQVARAQRLWELEWQDTIENSRIYTEETARLILRDIAYGATLAQACQSPDRPAQTTFSRWVAEDRWDLKERYKEALRLRADSWADGVWHDLQGDVTPAWIALRMKYIQWRNAVDHPAAYAPRRVLATEPEVSELDAIKAIAVPYTDLDAPDDTDGSYLDDSSRSDDIGASGGPAEAATEE